MEELRALCGALLTPAGLVATLADAFHSPLDTSEFVFAEAILEHLKTGTAERWSDDQRMMMVRYVVELCDWDNITHHRTALQILVEILDLVAVDTRLLPQDLEATINIFTPDIVQTILDGATETSLVRTLLKEYHVRVLQGLALYGLQVIPDSILFDIDIEDAPTYHPRAVMIATPIIDIISHSRTWCWPADEEPSGTHAGVLECLRAMLERMPERGFLSKRVEVMTGKFQYVLHAILFEITMNTSHDGDGGYRFNHCVAEVLDLIFHKTPRLREDIRSVQNKTSDHCFEKKNGYYHGRECYDSRKWYALTVEDIVELKYDGLRSIVATTTKGAFDE